MRRLFFVGITIAALAGTAEALTIRDVIELTRAGLGDEVLLALIDVDRSIYAIDTATLKQLKKAGVSERVIVALVRSGREVRVEPPAPITDEPPSEAPAPQVVVVDHHDHPPVERVREVPVAVPVYVPIFTRSRHRGVGRTHDTRDESTFLPFQSGPPLVRPVEQRKAEPVYWGFGGKLRPDAWQPDPKTTDRKK